MGNKTFKFSDSILVHQPVNQDSKSDAIEVLNRDRNPVLKVSIDTTHSGVITNGRVYPGKFVSRGYKSFLSKDNGGTAAYNKPVLKHHDLETDPIGRVVAARFSALKVGDEFEYDFLQPDSLGSKGSGIVTVDALITDPDAIKKIIDGRFLSVSAGHSTDEMLCSVCGDSIRECDHLPGKMYTDDEESETGNMCYGITTNMTYHEVSFVNLPAQPPAKVSNFNWVDLKDSQDYSTVFPTMIHGRKEMVRNLTLCDADGELSLLTGKDKTSKSKVVVAVSPAIADKLKHTVANTEIPTVDETSNVRPVNAGSDAKLGDAEQDLSKANTDSKTNKDIPMEKDLKELETKCDSLQKDLDTAKAKIAELEAKIEGKDSELARVIDDSKALRDSMSKNLAVSLAGMRVRMNKPDTKEIDNNDSLQAYVGKLAERSPESLQDAISDLVLELDMLERADLQGKTVSAKDAVSSDKLASPVGAKGVDGKPASKNSTAKDSARTSSDALREVFNLDN